MVSCSTKLHAFNLAEQLQKHGLLDKLYTTYAYQKNVLARKFIRRMDLEKIDKDKIETNLPAGLMHKWYPDKYLTNAWFEEWVEKQIRNSKAKVFIGWSGMSLKAIRQARKRGMITIVERGSSHIQYQHNILKEEYAGFGLNKGVDTRVIEKELGEYEAADYISVPSGFVKRTFEQYGVSADKLLVNAYGVSSYFKPMPQEKKDKFRIVYLGTLSIRKGLKYLFQALKELPIPTDKFEVHFIGQVEPELNSLISEMEMNNWQFLGHRNHYELSKLISSADVAVHPSIEEGMSMVILQLLSCGVPVIATTNTGGEDIIQDNKTGFIIPIRSTEAIAEKIVFLYNNPVQLQEMKAAAAETSANHFTWDKYGERYVHFLNSILS